MQERESKAKLLQFVSGANVFTFWITSFIWDYLTFFSTALIMVATIGVFREEGWSSAAELSRATVIFLLFGFAALPMTFIASLLFSVPSSGFTRMTTINIFTGNFRGIQGIKHFANNKFLFPGTAVFFVIMAMSFPAFDLVETAKTLKSIFLAFPHYALSQCLNDLNKQTTMERVCRKHCDLLPFCNEQLLCKMMPQCCRKKNR